jgi:hypothetical protein
LLNAEYASRKLDVNRTRAPVQNLLNHRPGKVECECNGDR